MSLEGPEEAANGALLMIEEHSQEVKMGRMNDSDDAHLERTDNLSYLNDQTFNKLQITNHGLFLNKFNQVKVTY